MFLRDDEIPQAIEIILALTVVNSIALLIGYLGKLGII